jgi:GxxExxY protein
MTLSPRIFADNADLVFMNLDLKHRELTERVIGVFYDVYNELGHGYLESIYATAMAIALRQAGLQVEQELPISVRFRGETIGDFKADLVVNGSVLLELKAVRAIDQAFEKQILNYLRGTRLELGLILNFGPKPEFRRFVYENERKQISVYPRVSAAASE